MMKMISVKKEPEEKLVKTRMTRMTQRKGESLKGSGMVFVCDLMV